MRDLEDLARLTVDAAYRLHRDLGLGLLETVYEQLLAAELGRLGMDVARQRSVNLTWNGLIIESAFRADLVIDDRLIVEIKSVERLLPVHTKQVVTYLRVMNLSLGLIMNFGGETLREGLKRVVNRHEDGPSRLSAFARNKSP